MRGSEDALRHPVPVTDLSESAVVKIAKQECLQRELPWREPIHVRRGWRWWTVMTNADKRGGNVIVMVSRRSGRVRVRNYSR